MPEAREVICKVLEKQWLTSSIFTLRFEPSKKFNYQPGQFLSIIIEPHPQAAQKRVRRTYSFSSSVKGDYELCVQLIDGGQGSGYLASLEIGDEFRATAPYGDFLLEFKPDQNICFIATGTGIAPFKSMVGSPLYRQDPPAGAMLLFGARTPEDVLFPGFFEKQGIEVVHALSGAGPGSHAFRGRVTDFLKSLPEGWPWQSTVFYICGNGMMIKDVEAFLREGKNVPASRIRFEVFFTGQFQQQQQQTVLKKVA